MNKLNKQVKELITILEKQNWKAIDFETVGAVSIKFALHKPQYKYSKSRGSIELFDRLTDKRVIIDIITAHKIEINEQLQQYEILLDNDQYVKMKIY